MKETTYLLQAALIAATVGVIRCAPSSLFPPKSTVEAFCGGELSGSDSGGRACRLRRTCWIAVLTILHPGDPFLGHGVLAGMHHAIHTRQVHPALVRVPAMPVRRRTGMPLDTMEA